MTSAAFSEYFRKAQDILVAHSLCVRATELMYEGVGGTLAHTGAA